MYYTVILVKLFQLSGCPKVLEICNNSDCENCFVTGNPDTVVQDPEEVSVEFAFRRACRASCDNGLLDPHFREHQVLQSGWQLLEDLL